MQQQRGLVPKCINRKMRMRILLSWQSNLFITMFTIQQVIECLNKMYSNASQQDKKVAMEYLELFQKSSESWQITNDYLTNDSEDVQIKLFLCQTLRNKLTYDLNQLGDDGANFMHVRDMIFLLMSKYNTPQFKLIRIQLNICLCQLLLQDLAWVNPLEDIINWFISHDMYSNLFEFLKILPEELNDINKTHLTNEEFDARINLLINEKNLETVFTIFDKFLNGNELLVLDCLNNWIKELPIENFLKISSLTNLIFMSLKNAQLFEKAIDCLITIVRETRDIENPELIHALLNQLLELDTSVNINEDNFELLARLYIESCESWHVLITKNSQTFLPLVEILLKYLNVDSNLNVIGYSFYFWYLLKQLLMLPNFKHAKEVFVPVYEHLISIIIKHLTYPIEDDESDLFDGDKEQEDKFKEFRYEMADVLKDATVVVGGFKALSIPFETIKSVQSGNQIVKWQNLESALFSMRAMAKEVPKTENKILPSIMKFLIELPEHPKIRYSATLVLGRYTEWTNQHAEFLEIQLNYIIKGFNTNFNEKDNKTILIASTNALMYFCQDCSKLLVNYLEQLYLLYNEVVNKIDIKSNLELIDGISHILRNFKESDPELKKTSIIFLNPIIDNLTNLFGTQNYEQIGDNFDLLSMFFKILKVKDYDNFENKIVEIFVHEILPIINKFLNKYIDNLLVNEKILKLIKISIESFNIYLIDHLQNIMNLLVEGFKYNNFGVYLYVSGSIIREFLDSESYGSNLINSIFEFGGQQSQSFFNMLQDKLSSNNNFNEISDTIEDFFRMLDDLLMYYPNQFFEIDENIIFIPSVELSLILIDSLETFESIISIIHYLIDLISWGSPNIPMSLVEIKDHASMRNQVGKLIELKGDVFLEKLLQNLIFRFNSFHNDTIIYDLNELILKIIMMSPPNQSSNWLMKYFSALPNNDNKQLAKLNNSINPSVQNKDQKKIRNCLKDFIGWYSRKNIKNRATY